jgi:patatin-like phospholipase/acyl hydrolase
MKKSNFKILVLDGGGSKGIYTLGVLNELELKLKCKLSDYFDLIYGTSTGSIIGSLIALGCSIKEIKELYLKFIPKIMCEKTKKGKSEKLALLGENVFGNKKFDAFKTDIGIVALNYDTQNPLVLKSNLKQAHGMKHSFIPGFGLTISDAVQASSSAYPIFDIKKLDTMNQGKIDAIDGGFIANNATLFALIDADKAFGIPTNQIKLFSIGTGKFVEKPVKGLMSFLKYFKVTKFIERIIMSSTNTNVILTKLLYKDINMVRINNAYNEPEYGTNMIENDLEKLEKLYQLGRSSYANQEIEINKLIEEKSAENNA